MKQALLTAMAALIIGLLAPTGGPAKAGGVVVVDDPPSLSIRNQNKVEQGDRALIFVKLRGLDGEGAQGTVHLKVKRRAGGYKWLKTKQYDGTRLRFRTSALDKRGRYLISASFENDDTATENRASFRVVRQD